MIDTPQIVETVALPMAFLPLKVPASEIRNVMIPGLNEVKVAIAAQGIAEAGPWFTHHLRKPKDTFDFEICVPVAAPIVAAGRVQAGAWPAMKLARTAYHGDYSGLGGDGVSLRRGLRRMGIRRRRSVGAISYRHGGGPGPG